MQVRPLFSWIPLAMLTIAFSITHTSVHAGMIDTKSVINQQSISADKLMIKSALAREDVKQALLQHGVNPEEIQLRIDQLTDQELATLASKFDQLPAGGGAAVVLLFTGPVMLMLELMGMTDLTTSY